MHLEQATFVCLHFALLRFFPADFFIPGISPDNLMNEIKDWIIPYLGNLGFV